MKSFTSKEKEEIKNIMIEEIINLYNIENKHPDNSFIRLIIEKKALKYKLDCIETYARNEKTLKSENILDIIHGKI